MKTALTGATPKLEKTKSKPPEMKKLLKKEDLDVEISRIKNFKEDDNDEFDQQAQKLQKTASLSKQATFKSSNNLQQLALNQSHLVGNKEEKKPEILTPTKDGVDINKGLGTGKTQHNTNQKKTEGKEAGPEKTETVGKAHHNQDKGGEKSHISESRGHNTQHVFEKHPIIHGTNEQTRQSHTPSQHQHKLKEESSHPQSHTSHKPKEEAHTRKHEDPQMVKKRSDESEHTPQFRDLKAESHKRHQEPEKTKKVQNKDEAKKHGTAAVRKEGPEKDKGKSGEW